MTLNDLGLRTDKFFKKNIDKIKKYIEQIK